MFAKPAVKLLVKFFCETYSIELNLFGKYETLILYKGSHNFQLLQIITITEMLFYFLTYIRYTLSSTTTKKY